MPLAELKQVQRYIINVYHGPTDRGEDAVKIEVTGYNKRTIANIRITHHREHDLTFDAGGYRSAVMSESLIEQEGTPFTSPLFKEANQFISKLTAAERDELYKLYARAEMLFNDESYYEEDELNGRTVFQTLGHIVQGIYKIIKLEDLEAYIRGNKSLVIPPELSNSYETEDKVTELYKKRTFKLDEYITLLAVALGYRFVLPIWGKTVVLAERIMGKGNKEVEAFKLLRGTELRKSYIFERLEEYFQANLSDLPVVMSSVMDFVEYDSIPLRIIGIVSVRKLAVVSLSYENEREDHLMRVIFNYGKNKAEPQNEFEGIPIIDKRERGAKQDDNASVWTMFKMKSSISMGVLEVNEQYINKYIKAATRIEPDIDPERVELCVSTAIAIKDFRTSDYQKGLIAWVMSIVQPGNMVWNFDRHHLQIAAGIATAVVWHWDLPEVAILLTAGLIPADPDEFRSTESKRRISDENAQMLESISPYTLSEDSRRDIGHLTNAGIRGIENMVIHFNKEEWKPNCPKELAALINRADLSDRFDAPPNLRDQLAKLLIKISEPRG